MTHDEAIKTIREVLEWYAQIECSEPANEALTALDSLAVQDENQLLIDRHGGSVLPMIEEDGSMIIVGAISGGADYTDGEPSRLTLILVGPQGNERHVRYIRKPLAVEPSEEARDIAMSILAHQEQWLKGKISYTINDAAALITTHDERIRREEQIKYEAILDAIAKLHEESNNQYAAYKMRYMARDAIKGEAKK